MTEKSPSLPSLSIQRRWLNETVGFADLSHRGRLSVPWAKTMQQLLHGRLTNDIRSLKKGEGCYAAMTDNKGRVQADMQVYNLGDEYLIDYDHRTGYGSGGNSTVISFLKMSHRRCSPLF